MTTPSWIPGYYDDEAGDYDQTRGGRARARAAAEAIDALLPARGRCLDVAGGTGAVSAELADLGWDHGADHEGRKARERLPRTSIDGRPRWGGSRKTGADHEVVLGQPPRLVHDDARQLGRLAPAHDDQMDVTSLSGERSEASDLQRGVAAKGSRPSRVEHRCPHRLPTVRRRVLNKHDRVTDGRPSSRSELSIGLTGRYPGLMKLAPMEHTVLGTGQFRELRQVSDGGIHATMFDPDLPDSGSRTQICG